MHVDGEPGHECICVDPDSAESERERPIYVLRIWPPSKTFFLEFEIMGPVRGKLAGARLNVVEEDDVPMLLKECLAEGTDFEYKVQQFPGLERLIRIGFE
jgi:hypothetical protein